MMANQSRIVLFEYGTVFTDDDDDARTRDGTGQSLKFN